MQAPHHLERQGAAAGQYLVHAVSVADVRHEVGGAQPALFHVIFDGSSRVGQVERIVFRFVGLDQGD